MKKYEVGYILKPNLSDEQVSKITNTFYTIFANNSSNVISSKEVGLKDLAYEIQHFSKGYYVWLVVEATSEAIKEFNRVVVITEDVIRFIVIDEEK
ncbi:MAG: 30S ribosomal protein S6 [Acholeplasmatales bacterium]|jgi:small subunit ribosomal protein S6|nr:30S ribosomal protein S6 [Acholeplasmatales bacterium]